LLWRRKMVLSLVQDKRTMKWRQRIAQLLPRESSVKRGLLSVGGRHLIFYSEPH
jgi:hypothetical protein